METEREGSLAEEVLIRSFFEETEGEMERTFWMKSTRRRNAIDII